MADSLKRLRLFLASPGDLAPERRISREVVEAVNRSIRELGWYVELLIWEDVTPGFARPQAKINIDVEVCDLFVGLLWERWGQSSGKYSSGFEEEFETARTRRLESGRPEIWLVFKTIDRAKLSDPGEQLKHVLDFRKVQIERKELLFSEFATPEEWRARLLEWLFRYVIGLSRESTEPVASAGASGSSEADAAAAVVAVPSEVDIDQRAAAEIVALAGRLYEAAKERKLVGSDSQISELDIERLSLTAKALATTTERRLLMSHLELQRLYLFRTSVTPTFAEQQLLLRSLVDDRRRASGAGWWWLRDAAADDLIDWLVFYAQYDGVAEVRRNAIDLLRALQIRFTEPGDQSSFLTHIFADEAEEVRTAAANYAGAVGEADVLPIVRTFRDGATGRVQEAATDAVFRMLSRLDPSEAFRALMEGATTRVTSDDLDLASIGEELLRDAVVSGVAQARRLAAEEMQRRGLLTDECVDALSRDVDMRVRFIAYDELLRRGRSINVESIRQAFADVPKPGLLSFTLGPRVNVDELARRIYESMDIEALRKVAGNMFSVDAPIAYEILSAREAPESYQRVRADVDDEFTSFVDKGKRAMFAAVGLGELPEESYKKAVSEILKPEVERFVQDRLIVAGLRALAPAASDDDAVRARRYVQSQDEALATAAATILRRAGLASDAPTLIGVATQGYGEIKSVAAAAALDLAPGPAGAAAAFLDSTDERLVSMALTALSESDSNVALGAARTLLINREPSVRVKAVSFLVEKLPDDELEQVLVEYMGEATYYYNVVCWFDRVIHGPADLRELFRKELEAEGYRAYATDR